MSGNVCPLRRTPPTSLPVPQPLSCHQVYWFHLCSLSGSKSHMSTWCEPWEGPQTESSHRWGNWSPQTSRAAPWTEHFESNFLHCEKRVLSEALRLWAGPERLCYCVFPLSHGTELLLLRLTASWARACHLCPVLLCTGPTSGALATAPLTASSAATPLVCWKSLLLGFLAPRSPQAGHRTHHCQIQLS